MKIKYAIFFGAFSAVLLLGIGFLSNNVYAISPPLAPGCYNSNSGDYVSTQCSSEGQARSIVEPYNKCFVISANNGAQGAVVNQEIDCSSGQTIVEEPENDNEESDGAAIGNDLDVGDNGQKIFDYIQTGINLLTAFAGIAITGAVIFAGIEYSTAGGNPQAAAKAKGRITNALIALLCLVFLFAFFQWLVPGGIFG